MAARKKAPADTVTIKPSNMKTIAVTIEGVAPYVQNRFSVKSGEEMRQRQEAGSTARKNRTRSAKDFEACYRESMYKLPDGTRGMPASAFRVAMVSACRLVGFKMTIAKLSVFVEADGFDVDDGTPLVRFAAGEPEYLQSFVRNATGVADIRARAIWRDGWRVALRVRYDADQFTADDVCNLLSRVGEQVGIGEGRPDSRRSCGMGWGMFRLVKDGGKA